jgi:hypothetical protein
VTKNGHKTKLDSKIKENRVVIFAIFAIFAIFVVVVVVVVECVGLVIDKKTIKEKTTKKRQLCPYWHFTKYFFHPH